MLYGSQGRSTNGKPGVQRAPAIVTFTLATTDACATSCSPYQPPHGSQHTFL
eukprot:m.101944 g.101944  ORF g.101944 m.101944 type:complete len:52 (-) comp15482_c0_seq1:1272-1427(-)